MMKNLESVRGAAVDISTLCPKIETEGKIFLNYIDVLSNLLDHIIIMRRGVDNRYQVQMSYISLKQSLISLL